MKKYYGKKDWSETPYYAEDYDFETDNILDSGGFFLPWPEFSDSDDFGFRDANIFEDKNNFNTYSELFNVYQLGKI